MRRSKKVESKRTVKKEKGPRGKRSGEQQGGGLQEEASRVCGSFDEETQDGLQTKADGRRANEKPGSRNVRGRLWVFKPEQANAIVGKTRLKGRHRSSTKRVGGGKNGEELLRKRQNIDFGETAEGGTLDRSLNGWKGMWGERFRRCSRSQGAMKGGQSESNSLGPNTGLSPFQKNEKSWVRVSGYAQRERAPALFRTDGSWTRAGWVRCYADVSGGGRKRGSCPGYRP